MQLTREVMERADIVRRMRPVAEQLRRCEEGFANLGGLKFPDPNSREFTMLCRLLGLDKYELLRRYAKIQSNTSEWPVGESLAMESGWTSYKGPRGGTGWKSSKTGRIVYQVQMPGDRDHEGDSHSEPSQNGSRVTALSKEIGDAASSVSFSEKTVTRPNITAPLPIFSNARDRYVNKKSGIAPNTWHQTDDGGAHLQFTTSAGKSYFVSMFPHNRKGDYQLLLQDQQGRTLPTGDKHGFEVFGKAASALSSFIKHKSPNAIYFYSDDMINPGANKQKQILDRMVRDTSSVFPGYSAISFDKKERYDERTVYCIAKDSEMNRIAGEVKGSGSTPIKVQKRGDDRGDDNVVTGMIAPIGAPKEFVNRDLLGNSRIDLFANEVALDESDWVVFEHEDKIYWSPTRLLDGTSGWISTNGLVRKELPANATSTPHETFREHSGGHSPDDVMSWHAQPVLPHEMEKYFKHSEAAFNSGYIPKPVNDWLRQHRMNNPPPKPVAAEQPKPEKRDVEADSGTERRGEEVGSRGVSDRERLGGDVATVTPSDEPGIVRGASKDEGTGNVPGATDVASTGPVRDDGGAGDAGTDGEGTGSDGTTGTTGLKPEPNPEAPQATAVDAVLSAPPTPETPTDLSAGNWRYQGRDWIKGGLKTKFRQNVAALEVAKMMREEGRTVATPEEQAIMSKFCGWGQFPALFNDYEWSRGDADKARNDAQKRIDPTFDRSDWQAEQKQLKALIGDDWRSAQESILNAHYTHPDIVDAHWAMARKLGFDGGRYLEPSAGIGYYLGQMPADIASRTAISAVEKEVGSGEMLRSLYPKAHVQVQGFEESIIPDNFYDLIASNVPFGAWKLFEPRYAKFNANIHDHFFLKSADAVKPGGLVMHITSTGTMDNPNSDIRKELADKCELVAAYRFPGETHKENAGTSVVTDMVILRKKRPGEQPVSATETPSEAQPTKPGFTGVTTDSLGRVYHWKDGKRIPGPNWMSLTAVADPNGGEAIPVNQYWVDNPQNVLGHHDRTGSMYGGDEKNVSRINAEELSAAIGRQVKFVQRDEEDEDTHEATKKGSFLYADTNERVPNEIVEAEADKKFKANLQDAIDRLPSGVFAPDRGSKAAFDPETSFPVPGDVMDGAYLLKDGKIYQRQGAQMVPMNFRKDKIQRMIGMMELRDLARQMFYEERTGQDSSATRERINEAYDAFVKKNGFINDPANIRMMVGDPDMYLIGGMEKWDAESKTATKAAMFVKPTVSKDAVEAKPESVSDGLAMSQRKFGRVDVDHIAKVLGRDVADVGRELVEKGLAYESPSEGWQGAAEYLSGAVRKKLLEAKAAAAVDPKYAPNVAALEANQPEDRDREDIYVKLGTPWIPAEDVQKFANELINARYGEPIQIRYSQASATWHAGWEGRSRDTKRYQDSLEANNEWGTQSHDIVSCLLAALNAKQLTVKGGIDEYVDKDGVLHEFPAVDAATGDDIVNRKETEAANAKVRELGERFRDWIWEDHERGARLERYYNDNYNDHVDAKWNGQHLDFPGMNPAIKEKLFPHIRDAVWRVLNRGTALLGHEMGMGKTTVMVASAMELRRLGLAKKPMIACLKSNIEQITKEAAEMYPGARIISTAGAYSSDARQKIIARMATGDYDICLVTHDQLNRIKMRPEVQSRFINEEIAELVAAKSRAAADKGTTGNRVVKDIEKKIKKLEEQLKKALDPNKKDQAMAFEDLGFDSLFIDEAHKFKSLPVITAMGRVKGIATNRSQRATDMLMRTRWLREQNGGRGVVFATGTPVSNTLGELYTMQKYLQPELLKEKGIDNFDAWAKTFAEQESRFEVNVAGELKATTRLSKFGNLAELRSLMGDVIDVRFTDEAVNPKTGKPAIVRPTRKDNVIAAPNSPTMQAFMKSLVDRMDALKESGFKMEKGGDNVLKICTDGRKASVDMRLLDDNAPDDPDSKLNHAVRNMLDTWKKYPDKTQVLFSDIGVNPQQQKKQELEDDMGQLIGAGEKPEKEDVEETDDLDSILRGDVMSGDAGIDLGSNGRFRLYDDIVDKLVKGGIPREKIADFSRLKGVERQNAIDDLRSGKMLIGLGTRARLGTGCNIQDNLKALHHLDVPWVPADVEQSDARAWRHGNKNSDIEINRYVTKGSLDEKFWDIIDFKTKFKNQVMRGQYTGNVVADEDSEALTPEMISAYASGDSRRLTKAVLGKEVDELRAAKRRHSRTHERFSSELKKHDDWLESAKKDIEKSKTDSAHLTSDENKKFSYTTPDGEKLTREKTEERIKDDVGTKVNEWNRRGRWNAPAPVTIGKYRGMDVVVNGEYNVLANDGKGSWMPYLTMVGPSGEKYRASASLGSLDYAASRIVWDGENLGKHIKEAEARREEIAKKMPSEKFKDDEQLAKKEAELKKITDELTGQSAPVVRGEKLTGDEYSPIINSVKVAKQDTAAVADATSRYAISDGGWVTNGSFLLLAPDSERAALANPSGNRINQSVLDTYTNREFSQPVELAGAKSVDGVPQYAYRDVNGDHIVYNGNYVRAITDRYPDAQPFIDEENTLGLKTEDGKTVGVIMPMRNPGSVRIAKSRPVGESLTGIGWLDYLLEGGEVHEAHAPKGFTHDRPLVMNGRQYIGGQFIPGASQAQVNYAAARQSGRQVPFNNQQQQPQSTGVPRTPQKTPNPSGSSVSNDVQKGRYVSQAMANLKKTSRTASGTVDTSASASKADAMSGDLTPELAAQRENDNFKSVMGQLHDIKYNDFSDPEYVMRVCDDVNREINKGITKEGVLLRKDDGKFPYTKVEHMEGARKQFSTELAKRLSDPNADPIETAAWIEWRVNIDHVYADGVGKTQRALAAIPLMRANLPLPNYQDPKKTYKYFPTHETQITPNADGTSYLGDAYKKWVGYYRMRNPAHGTRAVRNIEMHYQPSNPHGVDSMERHSIEPGSGQYVGLRKQLHDSIVQKIRGNVPVSNDKTFTMMGGGPASGKSSVIRAGLVSPPKGVRIDSDAIKGELPEYQALVKDDPRAADYVHEESSDVSKRVMNESLKSGQNVLLDGTGDSSIESVEKKAKAAREAGYKVNGHYTTTSVDEAIRRNYVRAFGAEKAEKAGYKVTDHDRKVKPEGRLPPEDMLRDVHRGVSSVVPEAVKRGIFDNVTLHDTEHQTDGKPTLVMSAQGSNMTIHHPELWKKFLDKANPETKAK